MSKHSANYLTQLHQLLNYYFNFEEIRTLCFDLNIDHESVPGAEKSSMIRELLLGLARSDRLPEVVTLARKRRPRVDWPSVPDDFELPESLSSDAVGASLNQYHVYGDLVQGDKIGGDQVAGDKIVYEPGATAVYQGLSVEEVARLVNALQDKERPKVWDGRIPYLGLTAFQESDAQFFFGREGLIDDLLEQVQETTFLTIAGPSGSGKSSVARAGLFHALRNDRLPRSSGWRLASMQPGNNPIQQLAIAIERLTHIPGSGDYIRQNGLANSRALYEQIETLLSDDRHQRFVLLVDQFEETFTLTKDETTRAAFIRLLTEASQAESSRAVIILALRSDFVSHCARYPDLRALMSKQFQLVGAMEVADLTKAITLPAHEVGAEIDPALVSRIITDMKGEPGALPLMSFALRDLFEEEKTGKGEPMALTLQNYLHRGGLESALERHANSVFAGFSEEQQILARSIFSKLIAVGQESTVTRRTATLSELTPTNASQDAVTAVLSALSQEGVRLITIDSKNDGGENLSSETDQITVTLAHEKLTDAWPWLQRLIDEDRKAIQLQNEVADAAQEWEDNNKEDSYLYAGARLATVEEYLTDNDLGLGGLAQQFIEASIAKRLSRERRTRAAITTLLLLTAIALVASIVAFSARAAERVQRSRVEAQLAEIRAQQTQGEASLLLALEAADLYDSLATGPVNEAIPLFIEILDRWSYWQANLSGHKEGVRSVAFADADNAVMSAASDGRVLLWSWRESSPLVDEINFPNQAIFAIEYEPISDRLAIGADDGQIHLHALAGSTESIISWDAHDGGVLSLDFGADGTTLVSGGSDGAIRIWLMGESPSLAWEMLPQSVPPAWINSVAFSPDGHWLVAGDDAGLVRIWEMTTLEEMMPQHEIHHDRPSRAVAFSRDSRWLFSGGDSGEIQMKDLHNPESEIVYFRHLFINDGVMTLASDPKGIFLAIGTIDGSLVQIEIDEPDREPRLIGQVEEQITALSYSPSGSFLVTGGEDTSVRIWNREPLSHEPFQLIGHLANVRSLAISPVSDADSGSSPDFRILSGAEDQTWRMWAFANGHVSSQEISEPGNGILAAASSADGTLIATGGRDHIVRIYRQEDLGAAPVRLERHNDEVLDLVFSPDGQLLASGSVDDSVLLWNAGDFRQAPRVLQGHADGILSLAFDPSGSTLAVGDQAGFVYLWDLQQMSSQPRQLYRHDNWVWSVAFSPDGQTLVSASADGTIRGYSLLDERVHDPLEAHGGERVRDIAFSPNNRLLATAGDDNLVKLWDPTDWHKAPIVLRGHDARVRTVAFSHDSTQLVTGSDDNIILVWHIDLDTLQAKACAILDNSPLQEVESATITSLCE